MSWLEDHWIVLAMLGVYTALIANHALAGKRRTKTVTDYYVGGRSMGGIALGLSFFATYSSTNSFVGMAGQSQQFGAPWMLLAPFAVIACVIAWTVVAPRLRRFTEHLDSVTIPDFIGFRFSSEPARVAAALIVVFASFLYMTAVFKGIGNLLEVFLDVPYQAAIGIVFVIVVAYTAVGGFISVVKTDAVQGVVMLIAGVILFFGTTEAAGGVGVIFEMPNIPESASLFSWDKAMAFPVLLGMLVAGTMKLVVEPKQLSRFYALDGHDSAGALRKGLIVSTLSFLILYALLVPIGLYATRILPAGIEDSDTIVPSLLGDARVFSTATGSFLMVAMVAAAMSSLDSVLLVTATTCERDLLSRFRREGQGRALRNTRWLVALLALITAAIALNPPGQIVALTTFSGSLFAACFLPAIVIGLHWRRGNGAGVLASFAAGVGTLWAWDHLPFAGDLHAVFPAMLLSTTAFVLLGWSEPQPRDPRANQLFENV